MPKSVCPKHIVAYEVSEGCTWCVPDTKPSVFVGKIDITLPDPLSTHKGYDFSALYDSRLDVMLHLRESYTVDASVMRWDGVYLSPATSRMHGTIMEKSFYLDQVYGSWVASYLGHDGEVWKSHVVAEFHSGKWEFTVKEYK
jgi:hypothetical protein